MVLRNVVPRQGTETSISVMFKSNFSLRNVVPRQGTETFSCQGYRKLSCPIEKCSSPTGDGNDEWSLAMEDLAKLLRNVVPRQGTETPRSYPHIHT